MSLSCLKVQFSPDAERFKMATRSFLPFKMAAVFRWRTPATPTSRSHLVSLTLRPHLKLRPPPSWLHSQTACLHVSREPDGREAAASPLARAHPLPCEPPSSRLVGTHPAPRRLS